MMRFSRAIVLRVSMLALIMCLGVSAFADGSPTQWVPPTTTDYAALTSTFGTALAPILSQSFPLLLGIMAFWMGPRLLKKLIKSFTN